MGRHVARTGAKKISHKVSARKSKENSPLEDLDTDETVA